MATTKLCLICPANRSNLSFSYLARTLLCVLPILAGTPSSVLSGSVLSGHMPPEPARETNTPPSTIERAWVVPQSRRVIFNQHSPIQLRATNVTLEIDGLQATTQLELTLHNPSSVPQEAQVLLPVPDQAAVKSLQYDGTGPEPTAQLLPRQEARRIYSSIVASMRDPALLEFAGQGVIRTSAFPVPPNSTQKLRITLEQVLTLDSGRIDFVLPRSESMAMRSDSDHQTAWTFSATVRGSKLSALNNNSPINSVFSPSHELAVKKEGQDYVATATDSFLRSTGAIRLSILMNRPNAQEPVSTVIATPDPDVPGTGYWMMLVSLPEQNITAAQRDVTLVIDRSGSMVGKKFEQAQLAATRVINSLADGERFNIIDYSDTVQSFKPELIAKDANTLLEATRYIKSLTATGGTNIRDALVEALRPATVEGRMPQILFVTDGIPTVGERTEAGIRQAVTSANKAGSTLRRIFTFGVGFDVNTPLLTALARDAKGSTTFVAPDEDLEVKVSQAFARLSGPILLDPRMQVIAADGKPATTAIKDLIPASLSDVYQGEQIIIMGRYTDAQTTPKITIEGSLGNRPTTMNFDLDVSKSSLVNGYVARAWAMRKIGSLIEELRTNYANVDVRTDKAGKELVDEIVRLSIKFGVLTEYTAFLATEPNRAITGGQIRDMARTNVQTANAQRAGGASTAQDMQAQKYAGRPTVAAAPASPSAGGPPPTAAPSAGLTSTSTANKWYTYNNGRVDEAAAQVNHIANRAYFQRNNQWVQGDLIAQESEKPDMVVQVGTPEYELLADKLLAAGFGGLLGLDGKVLFTFEGKRIELINSLPN